MKLREMRKLGDAQLAEQLRDARLELAKERAASEIGTVKNPGRIRSVRRTIARIQTIMHAKQGAKARSEKAQSEKPQSEKKGGAK